MPFTGHSNGNQFEKSRVRSGKTGQSLNPTKTVAIVFTRRCKWKSECKNLGYTSDGVLSWKFHLEERCMKITGSMDNLSVQRKVGPRH